MRLRLLVALLLLTFPGLLLAENIQKAVFAGGCFWCMEPPFDKLEGVISTTSGYAGGNTKNPSYGEVSSGRTGHAEVVQIVYDQDKVSYETLLEVFWRNIDPTVKDRQFCDRGNQYRTGIYFLNEMQRKAALESKKKIDQKFDRVYTEIEKLNKFYPAEEYHQDYYKKNSYRYKYYRYACGRDQRLTQLWGDS